MTKSYKFAGAVVLTGIISGVGGMLLAMLLHAIQHLAFGYSPDAIISAESFLQGVSDSSPERRVIALICGGLIAGIGWWLLARYGKPRVSVDAAVKDVSRPMPLITTFIHALLQIITVALGSPLGREVAPREIGALGATSLTRGLKLDAGQSKVLIACGAGAGLAAVYNVPLAGAIFTLEVLLISFRWNCVLPAMVTSSVAALVASFGLGTGSQYHFSAPTADTTLIVWAIVTSPIFGYAAHLFRRYTAHARKGIKTNWQMPVLCLVSFGLTGLLSVWFPQLPGNGKGPTQLALHGDLQGMLPVLLLLFKLVLVWGVLRAGAEGGVLTPGFTVGALLASILFSLCSGFLPAADQGSITLIGAAAFLASSMQMPLTTVLLAAEFTRMDSSLVIPVVLAVGGSFAVCCAIEKRAK